MRTRDMSAAEARTVATTHGCFCAGAQSGRWPWRSRERRPSKSCRRIVNETLVLVFACVAAYSGASLLSHQGGPLGCTPEGAVPWVSRWLPLLAVLAVSILVCLRASATAHSVIGERDRLLGVLEEGALNGEREVRLAESAARLEERTRIAEEVHDLLGHRISLISVFAGALELDSAAECPRVRQGAQLVRGSVGAAMQELRGMLDRLRADNAENAENAENASAPKVGTWSDIAHLVQESRAAGLPIDLEWRGDDLVDADSGVQQAVHRIVRESLTNIHRHAPGAPATVVVEHGATTVGVFVRNGPVPVAAGAPGASRGTGQGLLAARKRVRLMGGTFAVGTDQDGGFALSVVIPVGGPSAGEAILTRSTGLPGPPGTGSAAGREVGPRGVEGGIRCAHRGLGNPGGGS